MLTAVIALLLKYFGGQAFVSNPWYLEIFMGQGSGFGCKVNQIDGSGQTLQIADQEFQIACSGSQAAYRVCAGASFFFLGSLIVAPICKIYHTGLWPVKFILWLGLIIACFFIPKPFYDGYIYVAMVGSMIYLILQVLSLMDCAYKTHECMLNKSDEEDEKKGSDEGEKCTGCKIAYVILSFTLIAAFIAATVMMYITFGTHTAINNATGVAEKNGVPCAIGVTVTTLMLIFAVILVILSVVGKLNVGLLPGSFIICYLCWLTFSALSSNPDSTCNPFSVNPVTDRTVDTVFAFLFIVLSLGWTAFSTAVTSPGLSRLHDGDEEYEDEDAGDLEMSERQAENDLDDVLSGNKKASASYKVDEKKKKLTDSDEEKDNNRNGSNVKYESCKERGKTAMFHVMMLMATFFAAMMTTNWEILEQQPNGTHYKTGSEVAMWIQIATALLCFLIFVWTLIAPLACKNRIFD